MSERVLGAGLARGPYPEREAIPMGWLDRVGERIASSAARRVRLRASAARRLLDDVARQARVCSELDDAGLRARARWLGLELRHAGLRHDLVARCFAVIREVAGRSLGQWHHDGQLRAGLVLLNGGLAELEGGEGKTLAATLAAGTAALAGVPTHVLASSDFLAARDAAAMRPLYEGLGLSVGLVEAGSRQDQRRAAYACDVTYGAGKIVAFDYLRDRVVIGRDATRIALTVEKLFGRDSRTSQLVLKGLCYAIVDDADATLVDEARTPLVISDRAEDHGEAEIYRMAIELARELERDTDFSVHPESGSIEISDQGRELLEKQGRPIGGVWRGSQRREDLVRQALTALWSLERDRDYRVKDGEVQLLDGASGGVMLDRSWEHGLHQLVEVKEDVEVTGRREPRARLSYQRFFRRYLRLAGLAGTASEVAGELGSIYGLPVVSVPARQPTGRGRVAERVFASRDEKLRGLVARVTALHATGRPILLSVRERGAADTLGGALRDAGLEHEQVDGRRPGEALAAAGQPGRITLVSELAGRGTHIELGDGVAELGGLAVIISERHDARRLDREFMARAGRGGEPATCEVFLCADDEVLDHAGSGPLQWAAEIPRLLPWAVYAAQLIVQRQHAGARRRLVQLDETLDTTLAFSGRSE